MRYLVEHIGKKWKKAGKKLETGFKMRENAAIEVRSALFTNKFQYNINRKVIRNRQDTKDFLIQLQIAKRKNEENEDKMKDLKEKSRKLEKEKLKKQIRQN